MRHGHLAQPHIVRFLSGVEKSEQNLDRLTKAAEDYFNLSVPFRLFKSEGLEILPDELYLLKDNDLLYITDSGIHRPH